MRMNRKQFLHVPFLMVGMMLAACSGDDVPEGVVPESPETPVVARTWRVSIHAGQNDADKGNTRAISIGGNTGQRLYTNWDEGDLVEAVSGGAVVGTLTARISGNNSANAQLDGSLSGTYAVGDAVTLYNHCAALDYSMQLGTIADVSTNYAYLMGESTVKAVDEGGGFLQMSDAAFTHMQAFLELTFTNQSGTPLNVEVLNIYSASGKLVLTKAIDGTTTYATAQNRVQLIPASAMSKFFFALRNESGASDTYTFLAVCGSTVYTASVSSNLQYGHYYRGTVKLSETDISPYYLSPVNVSHPDYGDQIDWESLLTGVAGRQNYGAQKGWASDVTDEINRYDYGLIGYWESLTTGEAGRQNYGKEKSW